jgi:hypothetical protein
MQFLMPVDFPLCRTAILNLSVTVIKALYFLFHPTGNPTEIDKNRQKVIKFIPYALAI